MAVESHFGKRNKTNTEKTSDDCSIDWNAENDEKKTKGKMNANDIERAVGMNNTTPKVAFK